MFAVSSTQAQLAQKGKSFLQLGYGLPSATHIIGTLVPFDNASNNLTSSHIKFRGFGPLHFRFEYMLGGRVGLGLSSNAEFGQFNYKTTFFDNNNREIQTENKFIFSSINALARFNFHFLKNSEKFDLYWGLGAGYGSTKITWNENPDVNSGDIREKQRVTEFTDYITSAYSKLPLALENVVGLRYAITPNSGFYAEAGMSKSILQIGFFGKLGHERYEKNYWRSLR